MLINKPITTGDVKFISYTGKYPALCCGVLTLEINGVRVSFGHDKSYYKNDNNDGNYDSFWHTGGRCGFRNHYKYSYCETGEWIIDAQKLPEKYRKFADEIDRVFNDNVEWGCCGGCI